MTRDSPALKLKPIMRGRFGAGLRWIDCVASPCTMKSLIPSFTNGVRFGDLPEPLEVSFVVREEQRFRVLAMKPVIAERVMTRRDLIVDRPRPERRLAFVAAPAPGVAEPERRQHVKRRCGCAPICRRDPNEMSSGDCLRVLDIDLEKAVAERTRVFDLELRFASRARRISSDQFLVRKRCARITIEHPHVAV